MTDSLRTDSDQRQTAARWKLLPAVYLVALVAAVFLHESLFGGKVLTQIDALMLFEPWASEAPADFRASNELLLDQGLQMLPFLEFFQERIAAGEMPLWNPHNYAGHPIAAVPTGGLFWPLHWFYFAFPTWNYHAWSAFLRITLTGLFMLLFLREIGTARLPATLGAIAFALCGFSIVWLNHPHTQVSMFLPLLLYFVERASTRPNLRMVGLLAPIIALVFLGSHLQTAAHVLIGFGMYVVFRLFVPINEARLTTRGIAHLAGAGALGALIAMPLLLPFFEYMSVSQGAIASAERNLVAAVEPTTALSFVIAPDHAGHPLDGDYTGPLGAHLNYQELVGGWVGRLVLLLSLAALFVARKEKRTWFFAGLGLFAVLVACQVPFFYDAMRSVPLVKSSKLFRFFLLVAFSLSTLGALGLDGLLRRFAPNEKWATGLGLTACSIVALELGTWGFGYNPAIEQESPNFLPSTATTDFLAKDETLFRVLGQKSSILIPNANLFYGVDLITGYDAMEYRTMAELIALLTTSKEREYSIKEIPFFDKPLPLWNLLNVKYVLADAELPAPLELVQDENIRIYQNPMVMPRAFVAREVVVIEDDQKRLDYLGSPSFDPYVAVLENQADNDATNEGVIGSVAITSYAPRRVQLDATLETTGLVVLTDAFDPGWIATVNGEPVDILRVDHTLRGVWLEAGDSRIEFVHDPASFKIGLWLAAIGSLLSLVLFTRSPAHSTLPRIPEDPS